MTSGLEIVAVSSGRYSALFARALLNVVADQGTQGQSTDAPAASVAPTFVCPDCGAPMTIIASLARPGGNITGSIFFTFDLAAKRVELLKRTFPRITQVVNLPI